MPLFFLLLVLGVSSEDPPTIEQLNELTAIRGMYDDNRNKFEAGVFEFEVINFADTDLDDAKRGTFGKSFSTTGFYAYDEKNAIYSLIYPDDMIRATSKNIDGNSVASPFHSFRGLTTHEISLVELIAPSPKGEMVRSAHIRGGGEVFYQRVNFPIDLGFPEECKHDLSRPFQAIVEGRAHIKLLKIDNDSVVDGIKVSTISTSFLDVKETWMVNFSRACIPILRKFEPSNGSFNLHILDDIRFLPGRGWLPHKFLSWRSSRSGRVVQITSASLGPVASNRFQLEYPEPIRMNNELSKVSYAPQKIWDLRKLPSRNSPDARPYNTTLAGDEPVMPGEIASSSPPYIMLAVVAFGTMAFAYGLLRWMTRYSGKSN